MIMDVTYWLFVGSALAFSLLLAVSKAKQLKNRLLSVYCQLCLILIASSQPYPVIKRTKKEKHFYNPTTGENEEFPSIQDAPTVNLSVVVPAYNEEQRCKYSTNLH